LGFTKKDAFICTLFFFLTRIFLYVSSILKIYQKYIFNILIIIGIYDEKDEQLKEQKSHRL